MMPIMTGLEMTVKLKSTSTTRTIPIILLTAKSTKRETIEGFGAGADDYLTKPFDTSELVMRVNSLVNARKMIRQNMSFEQSVDKLQLKQKSPFSERITKHIEQHLSTPSFNVDGLAEMLHMSRKTLTRKCNAEIGMSPHVYINQIRMHHATNLLIEGKLPVSEIGYALGFESLAYFSRSFKKHTGKNPSHVIQPKLS
jgi:YesN/AraC family two-component response regulator